MNIKPKPRKRRLVRGRDFDAWAWKYLPDARHGETKFDFETNHSEGSSRPSGKWVRVKFVEVKGD